MAVAPYVDAPRVVFRDFGPFRYAEVELMPLTLFVGRNSAGKSLILQMLWVLLTTPPVPPAAGGRFSAAPGEVRAVHTSKFIEEVKEGRIDAELFRRAVLEALEPVGEVWRGLMEERIREVFLREPRELVRLGASEAMIEVRTSCGSYAIGIAAGGGVRVNLTPFYQRFAAMLEGVEISAVRPGVISLKWGERTRVTNVDGLDDMARIAGEIFGWYLADRCGGSPLIPLIPTGSIFWAYLPDSRAGLMSVLQIYPGQQLRSVYSDFYELMKRMSPLIRRRISDVVGRISDFTKEFYVRNVDVDEAGRFYVEFLNGVRIPLGLAPSGVRESLLLALLLSLPGAPLYVLVEEPEAHLHPRAVVKLAELIAKAVNGGKRVVISTHSDFLLYKLNNLLMRSKAEKEGDAALSPDDVAVYLVKWVEDGSVVERLHVDEGGLHEEEFLEVTRELFEEESRLLDAVQKAAG